MPFRVVGVVAATSLHLAIGWALWSLATSGAPARPQTDDGGRTMMIVHLERSDIAQPIQAENIKAADRLKDQGRTTADTGAAGAQRGRASLNDATGAARTTTASSATTSDIAEPMADLPDAEVLAYRTELQAHLARYRVYPAAARSAGSQGVVVIHFISDRQGAVLDAWIESSSGVSAIDQEALQAVARAQPLPPLPGGWPERVDISLPVTFKLG